MDIIIINSDKLSRSHDDLFLGVTVLGQSLLPPPRRLSFHRLLFVSRIMQELLNRFSQNLVDRWQMGQENE